MPSKRAPLAKQKASIGWLANTDASAARALPHQVNEVLERVKKCFAMANHPNSNENEARAAVRMASKIMDQYNITQAEVMDSEDAAQRAERGGLSTVNITAAKDKGATIHQIWVHDLVNAMRKFFDCSAYSTAVKSYIEWTFYGIAEHTSSAAMAFETTHNMIQEWAEVYQSIAARNSYSLGVADGLCRLADEERKELDDLAMAREQQAMAARIRGEEIGRQKEIDRLRNPPEPKCEDEDSSGRSASPMSIASSLRWDSGASEASLHGDAVPDFDEESEKVVMDTQADFDTELKKFKKTDATPDPSSDDVPIRSTESSTEQNEMGPTVMNEWQSMRELTVFREQTKEIEETVLKEKGITLGKGKKRKRSVKDGEAFKQGRKDSKKINIKAARIEDGEF